MLSSVSSLRFFAQGLAHTLEVTGGIDQLHLVLTPAFLAVGQYPNVGKDARVVEHLIWKGNDRFEPVVLKDPAADLRLSLTGTARKQWGSVEDNGDTGAWSIHGVFRIIGSHLRDHVLQERERRASLTGRSCSCST